MKLLFSLILAGDYIGFRLKFCIIINENKEYLCFKKYLIKELVVNLI